MNEPPDPAEYYSSIEPDPEQGCPELGDGAEAHLARDGMDEWEEREAEGRDEFWREETLGRLVDNDWDDWWEWLLNEADDSLGTAKFVDWLHRIRQLLDSFEPELVERPRDVRVDEKTFSVHCDGRVCRLGNTQQFRLIRELAGTPNEYVPHRKLLQRMEGADCGKITYVKSRLVRKLRKAGMGHLARCIHTDGGYYGLLLRKNQ